MSDFLSNKLLYYKTLVAIEKGQDSAIDPMNRFKDLPPVNLTRTRDQATQTTGDQEDPEDQEDQEDPESMAVFKPTEGIISTPHFNNELYDYFLEGNQEAITKARQDFNGAFKNYYLPLMMVNEAYKPVGERREFLGEEGMFKKEFETNDMVYYSDETGQHHIAIKGTNSPQDLLADINVAFYGSNIDGIMRDVDDDFKKILDENPDKNFNIYGHSLGSTRASILYEQHKDRINKGVVFNMGKSPLGLTGFKQPHNQDKMVHYQIWNDLISSTSGIKNNTLFLTRQGAPIQLHFTDNVDKYHKLKNFREKDVIQSLERQIIGNYDRVFTLKNRPINKTRHYLEYEASRYFIQNIKSKSTKQLRKEIREQIQHIDL